jgi:hypothetical protein
MKDGGTYDTAHFEILVPETYSERPFDLRAAVKSESTAALQEPAHLSPEFIAKGLITSAQVLMKESLSYSKQRDPILFALIVVSFIRIENIGHWLPCLFISATKSSENLRGTFASKAP